MWKCQNLLRHQVKDLVDLIKQPKVSSNLSLSYHEYAVLLNMLFLNSIYFTISSLFLMTENIVKVN